MTPRWYLAGPMSGLPHLNFPLFHSVTDILRRGGRDVINPAEINFGAPFAILEDPVEQWRSCMRKDIAGLLTCTGIMLLPGWRASKGATLEHHIAAALGMTVEFVAVQTWPDGGPISIALGTYQEFNEPRMPLVA